MNLLLIGKGLWIWNSWLHRLSFVRIKYYREDELECWRLLPRVPAMGWCWWHRWPWDRRGSARTCVKPRKREAKLRLAAGCSRCLLCLWLRARVHPVLPEPEPEPGSRGQAPSRVWGAGSVQAVRQLPSSHQPENNRQTHWLSWISFFRPSDVNCSKVIYSKEGINSIILCVCWSVNINVIM